MEEYTFLSRILDVCDHNRSIMVWIELRRLQDIDAFHEKATKLLEDIDLSLPPIVSSPTVDDSNMDVDTVLLVLHEEYVVGEDQERFDTETEQLISDLEDGSEEEDGSGEEDASEDLREVVRNLDAEVDRLLEELTRLDVQPIAK